MTVRERFLKTCSFERPDRLPVTEWAAWWDKTLARWEGEGLKDTSWEGAHDAFGLDQFHLLRASRLKCNASSQIDESIEKLRRSALALKERHERGEIIIRLWLDGYFWFPREIMGIERHLYAFYDEPEALHELNNVNLAYQLRAFDAVIRILKPDMVGFAEDMSYNLGPMLSYEHFHEFLMLYYQRIIPVIKAHGIKVWVDSDGDVSSMIPWLLEAGFDGVYPLERQAGVDIVKLRRDYSKLLMMGGYDKMVMPRGEAAMREEFERILPVMRSLGYIPGVDHQTPPGVSLGNYRIYVRLFKEYCERAVSG